MAEFGIERATSFINEVLWLRWEAEHAARERNGAPGIPRVTESRRALFREWHAVVDEDPSGPRAQALVARSRALLEAETEGDEEIKTDIQSVFRRRRHWPVGMKRYMASLYETDAETWDRVTDFIERAAG